MEVQTSHGWTVNRHLQVRAPYMGLRAGLQGVSSSCFLGFFFGTQVIQAKWPSFLAPNINKVTFKTCESKDHVNSTSQKRHFRRELPGKETVPKTHRQNPPKKWDFPSSESAFGPQWCIFFSFQPFVFREKSRIPKNGGFGTGDFFLTIVFQGGWQNVGSNASRTLFSQKMVGLNMLVVQKSENCPTIMFKNDSHGKTLSSTSYHLSASWFFIARVWTILRSMLSQEITLATGWDDLTQ